MRTFQVMTAALGLVEVEADGVLPSRDDTMTRLGVGLGRDHKVVAQFYNPIYVIDKAAVPEPSKKEESDIVANAASNSALH